MIDETLIERLSSLFPEVEGRFFHQRITQKSGQYPCVVYQRISRVGIKTLGGETGLVGSRYQLDFYTLTTREVRELAAKLNAATGIANGIKWLWVEDESDEEEPPERADERGKKRARCEITVWHEE